MHPAAGRYPSAMSEVSNYYLPPPPWKPKGKPYPSRWKMSREEAAARGLTDKDIVPGSTVEPTNLGVQSAGFDGPRSAPKG